MTLNQAWIQADNCEGLAEGFTPRSLGVRVTDGVQGQSPWWGLGGEAPGNFAKFY